MPRGLKVSHPLIAIMILFINIIFLSDGFFNIETSIEMKEIDFRVREAEKANGTKNTS
jgi:hypothetical protein